ncbi:MAG TPA: NUDIX hydrolase [Herpetosiphonaceae bacterium]|nr:NUDIX hydrolase [Herpetosiphonaceae bacterium]
MDIEHWNLPAGVGEELAALAGQHGQPLVWEVALDSASGQFGPRIRERTLRMGGKFAPLGKADRFGEVCMVVRRPDGSLITARKTYYPAAAFRLLTGGISHGEPVHAALLRETAEETGLEVRLRRFLAAVSYRPTDSADQQFFTFAFLLDELGGTLGAVDEEEQVAAFGFVQPSELPAMAETLEGLGAEYHPDIEGLWSDWGHFRAVIHRAVHRALCAPA